MRKWGRRPACHCLVGRKFLSGSITDSREGSDPRADAEDGGAVAEGAGEGGAGVEDRMRDEGVNYKQHRD